MKNKDETLALDHMRVTWLDSSTQLLGHFVSIIDAPTMHDSCAALLHLL